MLVAALLGVAAATACAGAARAPAPGPNQATAGTATSAGPVVSPARTAAESANAAAPTAPPAPPPPSTAASLDASAPSVAFPPKPVSPPFPASAQPGDGLWTPLGEAARGERLADDPRVAYVTTIHPHRVSRFKKLTAVVLDLTQVRVGYVPGREDVADARTAPARPTWAPGLVAPADTPRLLAIFNGGFKPRHGRWGMMAGGTELVPPRPEGCTVAVLDDGRVTIGTHTTLPLDLGGVESYRQTPPCLVEGGAVHPRLMARDERPWGGHDPKDVTRRRSALGVDASGLRLFYGMGEELEPSELAAAMRAVGAASAAELDINWSWTRFLLVGRSGAAPAITSTLIPQMVHERGAYLERPAARDFFTVTRRGHDPPPGSSCGPGPR